MRILLTALAAFIVVQPALAADPTPAAPPAPLSDVYACAAVAEDAARLACYDTAVGRLKAAEQAGEFSAVDPVKVRQIEKEAFGFSIPSLPRLSLPSLGGVFGPGEGEQLEELSFKIESVRSAPGLKATFIMDNGQTWQQVDTERTRQFKAGKNVIIRRAALGSYLMRLKDEPSGGVRVRRQE